MSVTQGLPVKSISASLPIISLASTDMKRRILLTDKCLGKHKVWRETGESFRAERYLSTLGYSLEQTKERAIKVRHTKSSITKRPYGKADLSCELNLGLVTLEIIPTVT